jgi:hypothetical protein
MRFYTSVVVCSVLTVLSVGVVAAQSALSLEGKWEGTLAAAPARGSRELGRRAQPPSPVFFLISPASDGTYLGKFWLNSGAKGPADIGEVAIDGDAVRIGVPSTHGVWEGTLSPDGLTLAGEWRQGGRTTPLVLRRTGNATDPARIDSYSPGTVIRR